MIQQESSLNNYFFPAGPNVSEPTTTPSIPRYPVLAQGY